MKSLNYPMNSIIALCIKKLDLNPKLDTFLKYTSFKRASNYDKNTFKISIDGIITTITFTIREEIAFLSLTHAL